MPFAHMMNPLISSDLDLGPHPEPEPEFDEKQDVATISADDSMEANEDKPMADDFEAIKKKFFAEMPDIETADETIHTWNLKEWRKLQQREHGPIFHCGGVPWRVLFFPFGNTSDYASLYLEHGYEENQQPESWSACAQFLLVLWNPNDPSIYTQQSARHRFQSDEGDWGFTRFAELRKLFQGSWNSQGRHLVEDDCANITAYVRVVKDPTGVLWHSFNKYVAPRKPRKKKTNPSTKIKAYHLSKQDLSRKRRRKRKILKTLELLKLMYRSYDSKKETGMVGLKNQGATCYLNSLLQSLYFTNAFRKAVYQIPTENEHNVRENSAYALQRLFYQLQTSDAAVSTNELTMSFGWESRQIFEQQDVQELSRILMERMEIRMKGTEAERALPELFVGSMKTYIQCINVDYESSRLEDFWDLQMNVRGNNTLDDSFKDYTAVETLDGDNKYHADKFGLQDAKKGVIFEKFPQVLHLQLKRFEYDFQHDAMMKVYDRYEFPEVWDASPYLSENADRSEPWIYHLHGILVHSGDLNAGHYYAFIKPHRNGDFYKFDDDRVTKATKKEAMDENFGGEFANQPNGFGGQQRNPYTRTWSKQRFMSAYMLVYIRESRSDTVLKDITEGDIPPHLERKIVEEKADIERKKREREEAHLYMQVLVGTDDNFSAYQGFDLFPLPGQQNVPPGASLKVYRMLKSTTIPEFKKLVSKDLGIDDDLIRPWGLVGRQNGTTRPDQPIDFPNITIEEACHKLQAKTPFRIWLETTSRDKEGNPQFVDRDALMTGTTPSKPIVLFLKHFDPIKQTLTGCGHVFVGKLSKIAELGPLILERMGWPAGTNIRLFEEIKASMIDTMNLKSTFAVAEIQDGDIVCFQRALTEAEIQAVTASGNYPDAPKFYDYLLNKVTIHFRDRLQPESEERHFTLELSKKMLYDQIAAKVGEYLKIEPSHLRFSCVTASNGKPRTPIKRTLNQTLSAILNPPYTTFNTAATTIAPDSLLYEVLDISLSELETKKPIKIIMLSDGIMKEETVEVLVPKAGVVADLVDTLQKKLKLSDEVVNNLRLYEVHNSRIYRELTSEVLVAAFNEYITIYAEQIPEEEREADPETDRAVYAYHFDKEPNRMHGVPFKFIVKAGEIFKDTKERLSKRTGIKGKNFEKIKFAVISRSNFSRPEYLQDDDILGDKLVSSEDHLGLDHINKTRNVLSRNDVMMIR